MQIETISLRYGSVKTGAQPGEVILVPKEVRSHGRPGVSWRSGVNPDPNNAYFSTRYSVNTKYIVDVTEHSEIGCIVTLASGKTVHIDETFEYINTKCNQR